MKHDAPLRARPPTLSDDWTVSYASGHVLREMWCQFTGNLDLLLTSDEPEVVHQARVGWRRFKSALHLFKPVLADRAPPSWVPLEVLLTCLGQLRDLDVAYVDTLPPFADTYVDADSVRAQTWQAMMQALLCAAQLQRKTVRYALREPALGVCFLSVNRWLDALLEPRAPGGGGVDAKVPLRRWSSRRIDRLHHQIKVARRDRDNPDSQHRVRILAKRLRYSIEALESVLPKRRAKRLCLWATSLQISLGASRDVTQASLLVAELDVERELVEFLRTVAVGQTRLA